MKMRVCSMKLKRLVSYRSATRTLRGDKVPLIQRLDREVEEHRLYSLWA